MTKVASATTSNAASTTTASVINTAIDVADFSQACIGDLCAILRAIRKVSDKDSDAYDLAGIGEYLADSWIDDLDRSRESIKSFGVDTSFKDVAA